MSISPPPPTVNLTEVTLSRLRPPGLRLVGRIGSEVLVSVGFQIFVLRILLHSAAGYIREIFSGGVTSGGK